MEHSDTSLSAVQKSSNLPETSIVAHAPGWTLYHDLYMSNGTLYFLTSKPTVEFPPTRMMISRSLFSSNSPDNIAAREPTAQEFSFITPLDARQQWAEGGRVSSIHGSTLLFNDPFQFLDHYYHFVAELLLGTWAFYSGAFSLNRSEPIALSTRDIHSGISDATTPLITRAIFMHTSGNKWRDKHGFNAYFLRAALPSLTVEVSEDWEDRVNSTTLNDKAWHFPLALLVDRSAAFRGSACGGRTQRTASEAFEYMVEVGGLDLHGRWWTPIREAVSRFAGVDEVKEADREGMDDGVIKITYISRQGTRRHLIAEDHEGLVRALKELVARKKVEGRDWDLQIVQAEMLTKDEQVRIAASSTILLGVHGNGLTHLVLMSPTRVSAVVEIFYPGGYAHDYEWTTRALGMKHFVVWNDTHYTYPYNLEVAYPQGFQGESIPVHGPSVAKLIEDRLEERL